MNFFSKHNKKNYNLSDLLSKNKNTIWEKLWNNLPQELCEIIFYEWRKAHYRLALNMMMSCSDEDIYRELQRRNQDCFSFIDTEHHKKYTKCMMELGTTNTINSQNTLVYSKNEIEYSHEITNMSIKQSTTSNNMPIFM